jgi:hypothetical protein
MSTSSRRRLSRTPAEPRRVRGRNHPKGPFVERLRSFRIKRRSPAPIYVTLDQERFQVGTKWFGHRRSGCSCPLSTGTDGPAAANQAFHRGELGAIPCNPRRAFAKIPRSFESQSCGDVLLYVAFTCRPRSSWVAHAGGAHRLMKCGGEKADRRTATMIPRGEYNGQLLRKSWIQQSRAMRSL